MIFPTMLSTYIEFCIKFNNVHFDVNKFSFLDFSGEIKNNGDNGEIKN